jgi:hypothetical protein
VPEGWVVRVPFRASLLFDFAIPSVEEVLVLIEKLKMQLAQSPGFLDPYDSS